MLRPCSLQLRRRQLLFSVFSPLLSFSTTPLRTAPRSQRRICPLSSPLSDHIFARCRRMQSFHRGFTQCKWKEVTFFQNRDIPPRRKNLQSSGLYCKYSLVRGAIYINSRFMKRNAFVTREDHQGICRVQMCWICVRICSCAWGRRRLFTFFLVFFRIH